MLSPKRTTEPSYRVPMSGYSCAHINAGRNKKTRSCFLSRVLLPWFLNISFKDGKKNERKPPSYPSHLMIKQIMFLPPRSTEKQWLFVVQSNGCTVKTVRKDPGSNSWKPWGKQPSNPPGIMGIYDRSLWFIVLNVLIFICLLQQGALSPKRFDNGLFPVT